MNIKDLRARVFAVDPHCKDANRQWLHWYKLFRSIKYSPAQTTALQLKRIPLECRERSIAAWFLCPQRHVQLYACKF